MTRKNEQTKKTRFPDGGFAARPECALDSPLGEARRQFGEEGGARRRSQARRVGAGHAADARRRRSVRGRLVSRTVLSAVECRTAVYVARERTGRCRREPVRDARRPAGAAADAAATADAAAAARRSRRHRRRPCRNGRRTGRRAAAGQARRAADRAARTATSSNSFFLSFSNLLDVSALIS